MGVAEHRPVWQGLLGPLAINGSDWDGPKLSNLHGARTLPRGRIQFDEKGCVAGSFVFEKYMECNGIRF